MRPLGSPSPLAPTIGRGGTSEGEGSSAGQRPGTMYVGMVASTKLHKSAVKRNRMRRRCREALRTVVREHADLPTCQLLICPRSSSLDAPYAVLEEDVRAFLSVLR